MWRRRTSNPRASRLQRDACTNSATTPIWVIDGSRNRIFSITGRHPNLWTTNTIFSTGSQIRTDKALATVLETAYHTNECTRIYFLLFSYLNRIPINDRVLPLNYQTLVDRRGLNPRPFHSMWMEAAVIPARARGRLRWRCIF